MKDAYAILNEYNKNLIYIMNLFGDITDNIQLNNLCVYLFNNTKNKPFKGVYSAEKMPKLKRENEMCIINTNSKKDKTIGHWIACYKYMNKTFVYDSFDRDVKSLSPHWQKKHNWVNANKSIDQSLNESNCGPRAVSWQISAFLHKPDKIMNII